MPWQNVGLLEASWEAAFGAQPVDVESIVTTVPAKADQACTNELMLVSGSGLGRLVHRFGHLQRGRRVRIPTAGIIGVKGDEDSAV